MNPDKHSGKGYSKESLQAYSLEPGLPGDGKEIVDIFNYYIREGFAAFPETPVPYEFYSFFVQAAKDHPAVIIRDDRHSIIGFGMLRPHNPMPSFRHTAEITYFIRPGCTGKGLGAKILDYLEEQGKTQGIGTILACISSQNEGSIRFHEKHGFEHCGRFRKVAKKKGVVFDTVWMQKFI